MAYDNTEFEGTSAWLQGQWSNPSDIFTILLIIGGDIVQRAIAQLCCGPIPHLTPVVFSFGWVSYAVSALCNAVGDNRLMPKPEVDCKVFNADAGHPRTNYSWILSRTLRDFEHWQGDECREKTREKLQELRAKAQQERKDLEALVQTASDEIKRREAEERLEKLPLPREVRIALRVTVWRCTGSQGEEMRGSGDIVYCMGFFVSALQLGIAAIPWGLSGTWYTFLVTAAGTTLSYLGGSLPQWADEKVGVRLLKKPKRVWVTVGNGASEAILITSDTGHVDLEALAAPQRNLKAPFLNQMASLCFAILWMAFLITVAGWQKSTWYLVGVGLVGILHNVVVAGMKRQPKASGLNLQYENTIAGGHVMDVLAEVEVEYPGAGITLVDEFFPGGLRPRAIKWWKYARTRYSAYRESLKARRPALWDAPPLERSSLQTNDEDIPIEGPYLSKKGLVVSSGKSSNNASRSGFGSADFCV